MMAQLLAHLWGDYILQSHWMAVNKTRLSRAAAAHALAYSLPFIALQGICHRSQLASVVICLSHFAIDRFALARYVVWLKNHMAPLGAVPSRWDGQQQRSTSRRFWDWPSASATGYPPDTPAWLASVLLIVADNTLHLTCNYLALKCL